MAESQVEIVTPVAPETPVVESTPALEPTADQVAEVPPEGEKPAAKPEKSYSEDEYQKALQKRLGIESRRLEKIARAEARAEFAEKQLQELRTPVQQTQQPSGAPKPEQFQDWESYNRALVKHEARIEAQQLFDSYRQENQVQAQQRQFAEQRRFVEQRLSPGIKEYADFNEVALSPDVPISPRMAEDIAASDIGWKVAYHLGQNIDEADRISRLSPAQQTRDLIKLETTLTAAPSPTRVPAPIKPDSGGARVTKKLSEMSQDEFDKARAAYKKRR